MEWDGGTIWRVALGFFFVVCGVGAGYMFFRLGSVLKKAGDILENVDSQVLPLLTRVEGTLDGVNSELDQVEQITGSVAEIVKVAEKTTTAIYKVFSVPLRKLTEMVTGMRDGVKSFGEGDDRKEEP